MGAAACVQCAPLGYNLTTLGDSDLTAKVYQWQVPLEVLDPEHDDDDDDDGLNATREPEPPHLAVCCKHKYKLGWDILNLNPICMRYMV